MLAGERDDPLRAEGIGRDRHVGDEAAGRRHDRGGVRVLVGVDPDDSVDLVCEHRHGCPPVWWVARIGAGLGWITVQAGL
jgi:hypothetical protein